MSKFKVTKEQAEEMQRKVDASAIAGPYQDPPDSPSNYRTGVIDMRNNFAIRDFDPIPQEEVVRMMKRGQVMVVDTSAGPAITAIIDIDPIGAPRQSRRDAWKPSPAVVRYRAWKDKFRPACEAAGWKLGPVFRAEFEIAMPASWSKKKKAEMNGQPHQSRPDWDNCAKAVCDAFGTEDNFVWKASVEKRWAEKGRIILYF